MCLNKRGWQIRHHIHAGTNFEHWPPEGGLITDQVGTWGVPLGIEEQITIEGLGGEVVGLDWEGLLVRAGHARGAACQDWRVPLKAL